MTEVSETQWHPIATAPRDQVVLIFSRRWGAMMATFRSDFGTWFSRMQCPASLNEDDVDLITHWMPLPHAPDPSERIAAPPPATGLPPSLARFIDRVATRDAA